MTISRERVVFGSVDLPVTTELTDQSESFGCQSRKVLRLVSLLVSKGLDR